MGCSNSREVTYSNILDEEFTLNNKMGKEILSTLKLNYSPVMYTEKFLAQLQNTFKLHDFKEYDQSIISSYIDELVTEVDIRKVFFKILCFFTVFEYDKPCLYRELNNSIKLADISKLNRLNAVFFSIMMLYTSQFNECKNEEGYVYRFTNFKSFASLRVGQTVYNKKFLFCSVNSNLDFKNKYFEEKNCIIKIKCEKYNEEDYFFNYLNIENTNDFNTGYRELIFSPFTQFKIISIKKEQRMIIELNHINNIDFIQGVYDKLHSIHQTDKIYSIDKKDEMNEFYYENQVKHLHFYCDDQLKQADTIEVLGILKEKLGKYEDAISLHKKVHKIRSYLLGEAHKDTAISYFFIGQIYMGLKNYKQAANSLNKSLDIRITLEDTTSSYTSMIYNSLGICYLEMKDYERAFEMFNCDIDIYLDDNEDFSKLPNSTQEKIASILNNLGLCCKYLGDYEGSIEYYNKSLQIVKNVNPDAINISNLYQNLALIYKELKNYDLGIEMLLESLNSKRKVYDDYNNFIAECYSVIGSYHLYFDNKEQGLIYLEKAISIYVVNEQFNLISDIYIEQAECTHQENLYENAIYYRYKHISKLKKKSDNRLVEILYKYGYLLLTKEKFSKAITTFLQLLQILENENVNNLLIEVCYCLAICYEKTENNLNCIQFYERVVRMQESNQELNAQSTIPNQTQISVKLKEIKEKNESRQNTKI